MFHRSKCDFCGECLARCHYINFKPESTGNEFKNLVEGKNVTWLKDCVTCIACNEYCPKGARPFDLILRRLEESGDFTDPVLIAEMAERFKPEGELRPVNKQDRVISICVMQGNMPWAIQGQLFENIPILKGKHYFCNVLFAHMGNESIIKTRIQKMVDNLAKSGAKEIVFVHDDCFGLLKSVAPEYGVKLPFRAVHLFEYLWDYLNKHKNQIKKLNMKIAYQRPCASRYTPEKDSLLEEIFDLTGIQHMKRQYDGINALCCGAEVAGPGLKLFPRGKDYEKFREKNVQDAKDSGAESMVYLCPMCFATLNRKVREAGMNNYMISDICRLALGETLPEEKPL